MFKVQNQKVTKHNASKARINGKKIEHKHNLSKGQKNMMAKYGKLIA